MCFRLTYSGCVTARKAGQRLVEENLEIKSPMFLSHYAPFLMQNIS